MTEGHARIRRVRRRGAGGPEGAVEPGRGGKPRLMADSLPAMLETLGLSPILEDARVFAGWEAAVGAEIARVARPHRLDGGTLIVHVKNSAWMAELSLRRSEILTRVNDGRDSRPIRQIVFRIETGAGAQPDAARTSARRTGLES
jgi:predicted nucleic acid-binding Zn ribbon protein